VVVIVVGGLVIARGVVYKDRSRRVTTDDALSRYRQTEKASSTAAPFSPSTSVTTTAPKSSTTLPPPGVYRYRTAGEESIDVLGGAHHAYPPETTITITPQGCGVHLRWDVLKERRDEWRLCVTPAGIVEPWALQYHEFFKQPDPEALVCPADTLLLPAAPRPGAAWNVMCTLAGDDEPQRFAVIGREALTVGSTQVTTIHVRQSVESGGNLFEHTINDWWLAPDGLPVRGVETKTSRSSSPIGPVTYREQYRLDLESLLPLR
jgi:hypothetical protein